MPKNEFKTIRQKTEKLLSQSEGLDVDFKEEVGGVEPEDLVAFANSPNGGFLLIGVSETEDNQGQQRGEIDGCDVSDEGKQRIHGQARSCTSTVPIDIYVENTDETAFFRVDIPRGTDRPYCTGSGKYRIRGDGRTRALYPTELLDLFVEEQSERFHKRFESAASGLEAEIDSMRARLENRIEEFLAEIQGQLNEVRHISSSISALEHEVSNSLQDIFDHAEEAQEMSESANMWSEDAYLSAEQAVSNTEDVSKIDQNVTHLAWKLNALLDHFDIEDPEISREREKVRMGTKMVVEVGLGNRNMDEGDLRNFYQNEKERVESAKVLHRPFEEYVSFDDVLKWYSQYEGEMEPEDYEIDEIDDDNDRTA